MQLCQKGWRIWQTLLGIIYFGSLGMMIAGAILCSGGLDYVCYETDCSDDDDGGTGNNVWGPCGLGYPENGGSTCEKYCGNATGVVCTKRDYSCMTNQYTGGYYCQDATRHCTDPTALSLVIIGSIFFGTISIILVVIYCICWNKEEETNPPGPIEPTVTNPEEPAIQIGEVDIEADSITLASDVPIHRAQAIERVSVVDNPSFDPPIAKAID